MENKNRKLLDEVIKDRLEQALKSEVGTEEADAAFKQAMDAIDRETELSKMEASSEEQAKKQEQSKKEARMNWIIKGVEIGVVLIGVPVVQFLCNKSFAKTMCNFEKDYTFTTSAGKSLSRLFKFGK